MSEDKLYFTDESLATLVDKIKSYADSAVRANAAATVNATLSASRWSNMAQSISITGMTADQDGMIGIAPGATQDQIKAAGSAGLYIKSQAAGTLTIGAME